MVTQLCKEYLSRAIKRKFHHQTNLLLTHWNKLDNTVRKESGIKCGTFYKKPFTMLRTSKQGIIVELKTKGTQQPRIMHKSWSDSALEEQKTFLELLGKSEFWLNIRWYYEIIGQFSCMIMVLFSGSMSSFIVYRCWTI